jgi:hypothetical protein
MTDTTSLEPHAADQSGGEPPAPSASNPVRRWPKRAGTAALLVAALLVGVLIGTSANNKSGERPQPNQQTRPCTAKSAS